MTTDADNGVTDDSKPTPVVTAEISQAGGEVQLTGLEQVPPAAQQAIIRLVQRSTSFSGPLPPPDVLVKYNDALPGAMDRILRMAESHTYHPQQMERDALTRTFEERKRGQTYGFILGLVGLLGGLVAIIAGHEVAGSILSSGSLIGLVSIFVLGRKMDKEPADDDKAPPGENEKED